MIIRKSIKDANTGTEYRMALSSVDYAAMLAAVGFAAKMIKEGGAQDADSIRTYALLLDIEDRMNNPQETS